MKKLLMMLLCTPALLISQNLEIKWSEKLEYDNAVDGVFQSYVGTNSEFVYAKFSNLASSYNKPHKKIKIVAFDKKTMQKVSDAPLFGYNKKSDPVDYYYYKTIVLENVIYVLWKNYTKSDLEIYAQSYDRRLGQLQGMKKIYEIRYGKKGTDNLLVLYNKDIGNKILLGKEFAIEKDNENVRIEYKIIDENFGLLASNQVQLPIIVKRKPRRDQSENNLFCSYEFADDGNIYVQDMITMSEEEQKMLRKRESASYPVMLQIIPESGEIKEYSVKFPGMNTHRVTTRISRTGVIRMFGFYSDLDKDKKGQQLHGLFHVRLDNKTFEPIAKKLSEFERGAGEMDRYYVIEETAEEEKDLILICTRMLNYTREVCNKTCYTVYYCEKSDIKLIRIDQDGGIIKTSGIDRKITYKGWDVMDINYVKKGDKYFLLYGSQYQIKGVTGKRRDRKSNEQLTDRFEYAVFDPETGSVDRKEHQVNKLNTKKEDRKMVDPTNVAVYNNVIYTEYRRMKLKPSTYFSCLCPPVFTMLTWNGDFRRGYGQLGQINALY